MLKFMGMDALRFSISWTRVLPSKKFAYAHVGYICASLNDPLFSLGKDSPSVYQGKRNIFGKKFSHYT